MQAIYEPAGAAREYSPLACNLYQGCTHGCTYCFAPDCLRKSPEQFRSVTAPRPGILEQLDKDLAKLTDRTVPVQFCFTSDPYQPDEHEHQTTRKALALCVKHGQAFQVLTKGGIRAHRDVDILKRGGTFGTTLLFSEDADMVKWEPGAANVASRVNAIRFMHDRGVRTWVSVEPVVIPEQAVWLIRNLSDIVDEWRVGKLNHNAHANTVDWTRFAREVLSALEDSGRDYMIKDALQPYLPQGAPTRRYAQEATVL